MPAKPANKTAKKNARPEASAVTTALTSPYNTMIPLLAAEHAWIIHPLTRATTKYATGSDEFLAAITELDTLGIGARIDRELAEFTAIDARWQQVADRVNRHRTAGAADAGDDAADTAAA